jgi:hypothetical protein
VTYDAPGRLYVVTGNHIVDDVRVAPPSTPPAPRLPVGRDPAGLPVLIAVGAGLTVVLALLGRQAWPLPTRDAGGMSEVPQALVSFLLIAAAACVWAAVRLVRPAGPPGVVRLWWGLLAGAAVVSVVADLSLASSAGSGQQPGDLVVRCLLPVAPAVLAGVLVSDAGRGARIRAALGTGLVTVPLCGLGWALASTAGTAGLADVLTVTGLAGVAPLGLAVGAVAADRRRRSA